MQACVNTRFLKTHSKTISQKNMKHNWKQSAVYCNISEQTPKQIKSCVTSSSLSMQNGKILKQNYICANLIHCITHVVTNNMAIPILLIACTHVININK